ncbi:MAG: hypothetical protein ACXVB0_08955 [Mucilaginibacter sp.]
MISINFGSLFTVELLHQFYTNKLCPDFNIVTSAWTQKVLDGHKALAKPYGNQLYTGIKTTGDGIAVPFKPFVTVEKGMQMTFFLKLNNPLFVNYTNLPFVANAGKIYYFTNRNNNISNGKNFLSTKILPYKNTTTYAPGDLAVNGSGVVFTAMRSNNSTHQFDTTHTDYWMQVDNNQYPSINDTLPVLPSVSTYKFTSPQSSAVIAVLGYDTAALTYTKTVLSKTIPFAGPISSFTLDLSALDPGKYKLSVNGLQQWVYINDEITDSSTFAVIDIFNDVTPVSCRLVNPSQVLQSPKYSIFFLNRATIWKYVLPVGHSGAISDGTNKYHFTGPANTVTSTTPIPLSDVALNLTLTLNSNHYTPIACADPQRLTNIAQAGDNYSCSEIFLNY